MTTVEPAVPNLEAATHIPVEFGHLKGNRFDVWLAMLGRPSVKATELIDELDYSNATIYRSLKDLEDAGLVSHTESFGRSSREYYAISEPLEVSDR